jgi:two-component system, NarL family, invasion response regulator UvrY
MTASITVLLVDDHAVVREGYRRLLERDPSIQVVGEAANSVEVSKASAPEVLIDAISAVTRGERYLSPDVDRGIAQHTSSQAKSLVSTLTAREFEVLRLLARGETVRGIGEKLGLSEKTVANHQSAIREKLGARNGVQLARAAAELGLSL